MSKKNESMRLSNGMTLSEGLKLLTTEQLRELIAYINETQQRRATAAEVAEQFRQMADQAGIPHQELLAAVKRQMEEQ